MLTPKPIPQVKEFPQHLVNAYKNGKRLGGGAYAQVRQHPKRKHEVIKKTHSADPAYAAWLGWTLANQHNPYFPKVYEAVQDKNGVIMVRMEKLTPLYGKPDNKYSFDYESDPHYRTMKGLENNSGHASFFDSSEPLVYSSRHQMELVNVLAEALEDYSSDMHYGNGMLRGNQLVITDPICGGGR